MIKNKSIKKSSIYKGLSLAFAGVFAASFFPVNVIQSSADYQINGTVGSEAIYVYNAKNEAKRGGKYNIRAAYFGSQSQIPVGLHTYNGTSYLTSPIDYDGTNTITAIESKVIVTYVTTGETVATQQADDSTIVAAGKDEAVWGTFEAAYAGEYKVTYSMKITLSNSVDKSFETSMIVYSKASGAYFEFDDNSEKVIPSFYDADLLTTVKRVDLPLPTVMDENEKPVDDVKFIVNGDTTGLSASDKYVDITVSGANGKATVTKDGADVYIDAKYFNPAADNADNYNGEGNYIVKYSYYNGGQFVKSITKTFTVSKGYYKDYKLALSLNGSLSSAVTGVAVTLPTALGKTDSKTTPASESVNIHYDVKAYRKSGSSYSDCSDDHADSIKDGKFTPWADGNYKIVYEAYDFYGNKVVKEDTFVDDVKDTQAPNVVIYDASNKANYVNGNYSEGIKEYIDASTALKSISGEGNIIVYAVGATDNVPEGLKYTRIVRQSSTDIEIKDYADKNLIFAFNAEKFLSNNYYVSSKLTSEQIVEFNSDESKLRAWLKENNFLIVTNDNTKTVEDGYAYIDATSERLNLSGDKDGKSYSVIYYAEDAAGNRSTELKPKIQIMKGDYEDTAKPEITFVTNLKNSYRTNSTISFEAPSASDDDTRMDVVVEYRYDTDDTDKWRTFDDEKYEIDLSEVEELIKAGKTPANVTIYAHATDDYGNMGEWSKKINIVDINDTEAPTIISERYNRENDEKIEQNTVIDLPTITLKDDNTGYINAEVYVTRVDGDNETSIPVYGKTEERDPLLGTYTLNAGKVVASYPGKYQVKVVFTDAGNNQITTFYNYEVEGKVVVEDPVITGIGTTLGDNGKGEVGESIDLPTPTIDYSINNETHGIFGVKNDDSKSALYFNVKVTNDAPSSYKFDEIDENTFTAYEEGIYMLTYTVKFSVFDKNKFEINTAGTAVVEINTENIVYPLANGDFVIAGANGATATVKYAVKTDDKYVVYDLSAQFESDSIGIKVKDTKYYLRLSDVAQLEAPNGDTNIGFEIGDGSIQIKETTISDSTELDLDAYIAYAKEETLKVEYKDTKAPVMAVADYNYPSTANVNDFITIHRPEAEDACKSGINREKSYVYISVTGGENTSAYYKTIKLKDWEKSESGYDETSKDIKYKVTSNGKCTIQYFIYDYAGNLNDECKYEIAVGDCVSPKVTIAKNFVKDSYSLGEFSESNPLVLDFNKLSFSDNKTSEDKLKQTIKVVLTNTSTGAVVDNTGDAEADIYRYVPTEVGTYELKITVYDEAGWESDGGTVTFEIKADEKEGTEVYEVVGTILIVVAVAILAGVVTYFVVSAVKNNKKNGKGKAKKA